MQEMSRIGLFLLCGYLLSQKASSLTCFNCQGIRHPRFCEYVADCSDGQVCGLERQVESNGAVMFSLGCFSQNTCSTNPSIVDGIQKCFHCCSTDLCNIDGCGEPDLGMTNGTVCYNCLGLLEANLCRSVSFCDRSELCYLEEKTHFNEKFYHSGCREKHICESQYIPYPIIGRRGIIAKRSTTHLTCCDQSLCNNEGTSFKETTNKVSTTYSKPTSASITNIPDICSMNHSCYNGAKCHTFNGSYKCICAVGYLGKQCEYSDGKGFSFMVFFHEGYHPSEITPKMLVASENKTRLSILYFNSNTSLAVNIDKNNPEYNLNKSVIPSDGIHFAGAEVHSDVRINVFGFLYRSDNSEGYLLMPMRFASMKYVIPSLPTYAAGVDSDYSNLLALTAVDQNTVVDINLKLGSGSIMYDSKQYANNDTIKLVLQRHNTLQLSHNSDLSGTLVTASKPIIALSGSQCNFAVAEGSMVTTCNPFIELVLPTDQLDNVFVTPHISTHSKMTIRVQTTSNTNLTIKHDNRTISKSLNARDSWYFYYNTISLISSSNDVLVVSYPHGLSGGGGDPFMMTIPGVNQYLYEYDFVVPTGYNSFISITVQSNAVDGFFLDGIFSSIPSIFSISMGMNHFSTFSLQISAGFHHIEHRNQTRFGLWVYGHGQAYDGYGYPAGMAYKINN